METFFNKNPNLKFKQILLSTNDNKGLNDIFEIFSPINSNDYFLASPNKNSYNIDIFNIITNQLINSIKAHNNHITVIKYYTTKNKTKEYLLSTDRDNIIIIHEITNNNYTLLQKDLKKSTKGCINSCLIIDNNYLVISYDNKCYTKIFLLENLTFWKNVQNSQKYCTNFLNFWKKNEKIYIIECSNGHTPVNLLENDELYIDFTWGEFEYSKNYSCVVTKDSKDLEFLYVASSNGSISIWNLNAKEIYAILNVNENVRNLISYKKIYLRCIIQWSQRYLIVCSYYNKGLKILDIEQLKFVSNIYGKHEGGVICVKKFMHPTLGECLLSAGEDGNIILWSTI